MGGKHLTFIVLSPTKGKLRQFRVARKAIAATALVTVVSLAFGGYGLFVHVDSKKDRKYIKDLRRETRTHQEQIQSIASEMDDLRQHLARLQQTDKKIRIIANLPQSGGEIQVSGVGGVAPEEGIQQSLQRERKEGWVRRIREQLDRLKGVAGQQETSFVALEEQLKEKHELLSSTPSIWPTHGWMTAGFGYRQSPFTGLKEFHRGVDVATKMGTPIIAPADGMVVETGKDVDYGEVVRIQHGFGYQTFYAHLSEVVVKKGQKVHRGQMIAKVGNSGRSTGPHLHYELLIDGLPANPVRYALN
jgi:murein DD-endopeptidase MepM/ murein hydrolase activator NlpD